MNEMEKLPHDNEKTASHPVSALSRAFNGGGEWPKERPHKAMELWARKKFESYSLDFHWWSWWPTMNGGTIVRYKYTCD